MFRVTTLDLENVPKNEDGTVDYTQDFFEKPVNLTVSGQLEARGHGYGIRQGVYPSAPPSVPRRASPPVTPPSSG